MNSFTPSDIDALRKQGLSYSEIGERFGITKDAARGLHSRYLQRLLRDASSSVASLRSEGRGEAGSDSPVGAPVRAVEPGQDRPSGAPRYVGFDIGYFDLEASSLNGSFGRLFSGACAHVTEDDIWVARIDDPKYLNKRQKSDDSKLAVAIRDHLLEHDIIVSWNGKRGYNSKGRSGFDIPMLNARLIQPENKQRVIGRYAPKHIDLLKEIRKYIELHSFRLAAVEEFLELSESKNSILPRLWNKALDGDKDALDYIVGHNILDVRVLRLVFEEMRRAGLLERPSW